METVETISIWTEYVLPFIQTWGALIVAALSIVIATVSLFMSSNAQRLQNKLNELELKLKRHELDKVNKEKETENTANVEARIIPMGNDDYRLKIWNSGNGTAYNVTVRFIDDPRIRIMDGDEKMPFEKLESKKSFELRLLTYMGSAKKASVVTEWIDFSGIARSNTQIVDR